MLARTRSRQFRPVLDTLPLRLAPSDISPMDTIITPPPPPTQTTPMDTTLLSPPGQPQQQAPSQQ